MELEFQVSEIFPTMIIKNNVEDYISDVIIKKVNNIIENMSEDILLSEAFSSRSKINDVLELSKFENLKEHLLNGIIKYTTQVYKLKELNISESFVTYVPKDGYFEIRKFYDSSFHILINLSSSTEIVLQNPIHLVKSLEYSIEESNKYNSQYSFSTFNQNEAMIIPSGIYYGFPKREKELKFITLSLK